MKKKCTLYIIILHQEREGTKEVEKDETESEK